MVAEVARSPFNFTLETVLEKSQALNLSLFNLQGQLVWKSNYIAYKGNQQLQLPDLARGTYFLKIQAEGINQSKMLTIEWFDFGFVAF